MTAPWDGHMTTEDMEDPRYFLYGCARIVMEADNPWYARMKRIGATEVTQEQFNAADRLRRRNNGQ